MFIILLFVLFYIKLLEYVLLCKIIVNIHLFLWPLLKCWLNSVNIFLFISIYALIILANCIHHLKCLLKTFLYPTMYHNNFFLLLSGGFVIFTLSLKNFHIKNWLFACEFDFCYWFSQERWFYFELLFHHWVIIIVLDYFLYHFYSFIFYWFEYKFSSLKSYYHIIIKAC